MDQRAQVLAQIAATLAIGQRAEQHMTAGEATRFVQNAELLLSTAEQLEEARTTDSGDVYRQAMERFGPTPEK